jgi:hypothetical protein
MKDTDGSALVLLVGPDRVRGQLGLAQSLVAPEKRLPVRVVPGKLLAVRRRPLALVEQRRVLVVGVGDDFDDLFGVDAPHRRFPVHRGTIESQETVAVHQQPVGELVGDLVGGQYSLVAVAGPELVPDFGGGLVLRLDGDVLAKAVVGPEVDHPLRQRVVFP